MHCGVSFYTFIEQVQVKEYSIPQWKNRTALTVQAATWMRSRLVLDDVLNAMNISSAVEWTVSYTHLTLPTNREV